MGKGDNFQPGILFLLLIPQYRCDDKCTCTYVFQGKGVRIFEVDVVTVLDGYGGISLRIVRKPLDVFPDNRKGKKDAGITS